jgi:hypothetical protein
MIEEEIEHCKQEESVTELTDLMTHLAVSAAGTESPA